MFLPARKFSNGGANGNISLTRRRRAWFRLFEGGIVMCMFRRRGRGKPRDIAGPCPRRLFLESDRRVWKGAPPNMVLAVFWWRQRWVSFLFILCRPQCVLELLSHGHKTRCPSTKHLFLGPKNEEHENRCYGLKENQLFPSLNKRLQRTLPNGADCENRSGRNSHTRIDLLYGPVSHDGSVEHGRQQDNNQ